MPSTDFTLTAADFEATYDGIPVCCSGEDGTAELDRYADQLAAEGAQR